MYRIVTTKVLISCAVLQSSCCNKSILCMKVRGLSPLLNNRVFLQSSGPPLKSSIAVTWAPHVYKHTSGSVKSFWECDHYMSHQFCGGDDVEDSREDEGCRHCGLLLGAWSPHSVFTVHDVSLWGKIRRGDFLWLRQCSLSLLPGWVSIGLQVHTLARRPPVAPTNCSIHSSAGDGRRPLIGYQRRFRELSHGQRVLTAGQPLLITTGTHTGEEGAGVGGPVTDRKSIGPLSKFLQRSSRLVKMSHLDLCV